VQESYILFESQIKNKEVNKIIISKTFKNLKNKDQVSNWCPKKEI
jgi:hypothetical protein